MSFLQALLSRAVPGVRRPAPSPEVRRLREMFDAASSVTVLAGSGLSAGSGLPTRRGVDGIGTASPIRYRHFLIDEAARLEQWRRRTGATPPSPPWRGPDASRW